MSNLVFTILHNEKELTKDEIKKKRLGFNYSASYENDKFFRKENSSSRDLLSLKMKSKKQDIVYLEQRIASKFAWRKEVLGTCCVCKDGCFGKHHSNGTNFNLI